MKKVGMCSTENHGILREVSASPLSAKALKWLRSHDPLRGATQRKFASDQNLSSHGIYNKLAIVPGAAHEDFKILPEAAKFFEEALA